MSHVFWALWPLGDTWYNHLALSSESATDALPGLDEVGVEVVDGEVGWFHLSSVFRRHKQACSKQAWKKIKIRKMPRKEKIN